MDREVLWYTYKWYASLWNKIHLGTKRHFTSLLYIFTKFPFQCHPFLSSEFVITKHSSAHRLSLSLWSEVFSGSSPFVSSHMWTQPSETKTTGLLWLLHILKNQSLWEKKKLLTKKVKYIQSFWELHNQENKHWKKLILFYRYFTGKWGLKKKCIS